MSIIPTGNVPRDALLSVLAALKQAGLVRSLHDLKGEHTDTDTLVKGLRGELPPAHPFYSLDRAAAWLQPLQGRAALIVTPTMAAVVLREGSGDSLQLHELPPDLIARVLLTLPAAREPDRVAPWVSTKAGTTTRHVFPDGWRHAQARRSEQSIFAPPLPARRAKPRRKPPP